MGPCIALAVAYDGILWEILDNLTFNRPDEAQKDLDALNRFAVAPEKQHGPHGDTR